MRECGKFAPTKPSISFSLKSHIKAINIARCKACQMCKQKYLSLFFPFEPTEECAEQLTIQDAKELAKKPNSEPNANIRLLSQALLQIYSHIHLLESCLVWKWVQMVLLIIPLLSTEILWIPATGRESERE